MCVLPFAEREDWATPRQHGRNCIAMLSSCTLLHAAWGTKKKRSIQSENSACASKPTSHVQAHLPTLKPNTVNTNPKFESHTINSWGKRGTKGRMATKSHGLHGQASQQPSLCTPEGILHERICYVTHDVILSQVSCKFRKLEQKIFFLWWILPVKMELPFLFLEHTSCI